MFSKENWVDFKFFWTSRTIMARPKTIDSQEPLQTLAKRAARSAASFMKVIEGLLVYKLFRIDYHCFAVLMK